MREEEVTSERDQTVLNLIDGVETGEDEAAPVEEEPGHNCSYTVPLSAPGPQHIPTCASPSCPFPVCPSHR